MTCKKCIKGNICNIKEYTMKCKICSNGQFYTRRIKHIPKTYVCSVCGCEVPIKEKKENKKTMKEVFEEGE